MHGGRSITALICILSLGETATTNQRPDYSRFFGLHIQLAPSDHPHRDQMGIVIGSRTAPSPLAVAQGG